MVKKVRCKPFWPKKDTRIESLSYCYTLVEKTNTFVIRTIFYQLRRRLWFQTHDRLLLCLQ